MKIMQGNKIKQFFCMVLSTTGIQQWLVTESYLNQISLPFYKWKAVRKYA